MARAHATTEWIDITMEFGHAAGTWPGDSPFEYDETGRIGDGEWAVNLTRFSSSPHNGTHSDAPFHVDSAWAKTEALPIAAFLGPCRVVDATKHLAALPASLMSQVGAAERVLFRTREGPVPRTFPRAFAGVGPDLARRLVAARVKLVGTDAPSIEAFGSKELVAHKVLLGSSVALLENLDLANAPPGDYELVALPLKVSGLCAAPVRAVLRPLAGASLK